MRDLEFTEDVLFKNFTRMSKTYFYKLLGIVEPMITKQNTHFRESVPAEMKLAITLRYLATGGSFMSLMYRVIQNDCRGFNNFSYTIHLR